MNRENFARLADHLETTRMGFTMGKVLARWDAAERERISRDLRLERVLSQTEIGAMLEENGLVSPPCGTAGCLIGHIQVFMLEGDWRSGVRTAKCADWLGLSEWQEAELFYAYDIRIPGRHLNNITKQEAINHLRYIAAGGCIGWNRHLMPLEELRGRLLPSGSLS